MRIERRRGPADSRGWRHPAACEMVVRVRWGGEGGVRAIVRGASVARVMRRRAMGEHAETRYDRRLRGRDRYADVSARAAVQSLRAWAVGEPWLRRVG